MFEEALGLQKIDEDAILLKQGQGLPSNIPLINKEKEETIKRTLKVSDVYVLNTAQLRNSGIDVDVPCSSPALIWRCTWPFFKTKKVEYDLTLFLDSQNFKPFLGVCIRGDKTSVNLSPSTKIVNDDARDLKSILAGSSSSRNTSLAGKIVGSVVLSVHQHPDESLRFWVVDMNDGLKWFPTNFMYSSRDESAVYSMTDRSVNFSGVHLAVVTRYSCMKYLPYYDVYCSSDFKSEKFPKASSSFMSKLIRMTARSLFINARGNWEDSSAVAEYIKIGPSTFQIRAFYGGQRFVFPYQHTIPEKPGINQGKLAKI